MKRIALVLLGFAAVSVGAFAQGQGGGRAPAPPPTLEPGASQADVDKALLAAPARVRNQASVIKWKTTDFTYDYLRKGGANAVVCYDRSGFPGHPAFSVECTLPGNLPRAAQNLKFEAQGGGDRMKIQALIDAAEKDGTRVKPVYGSVWYHFEGMSQETANPHMTIAVPGASMATIGLPENGRGGGVWIMDAGSSGAHLMTPGE